MESARAGSGISRSLIASSFSSCRDGYAADRVVADPQLNEAFIQCCRANGFSGPAVVANKALLNLRKAGLIVEPTSKRTTFADIEEFKFASEIAARFLSRRDGLSLDAIICDPEIASEFDQLAADISPGFTPLQYRWAALSLRKKKKLPPEIASRLLEISSVTRFVVNTLDLATLPIGQGVYQFIDSAADLVLYIGESARLGQRLRKHLDHSDNKGLARWLWDKGTDSLLLDVHELPHDTSTVHRRALEAELIRTHDPVFNSQR